MDTLGEPSVVTEVMRVGKGVVLEGVAGHQAGEQPGSGSHFPGWAGAQQAGVGGWGGGHFLPRAALGRRLRVLAPCAGGAGTR